MKNPFHFFGLGLALFCAAFNAYSAWWLIRRLELKSLGRLVVLEGALLLSAFYPASRLLAEAYSGGAADAVLWLGFFVFGASFIVWWSLLACDLLLAAAARLGAGWARGRAAAGACLAVSACLVALGVWGGHEPPETVRIELRVKGLPPALDGFKVMQVSDLHLGRMNGLDRLELVAAAAEAASPDLLVFTGDFAESREPLPPGACEAVRKMKARLGKAAVLGNHDMFTGGAAAAAFFGNCGVKLLRGQVYEPVPGLAVAGVDDLRRGGAASVKALAASLDRSRPLLFLSHQPQGFDDITAAGSGLVLSGHTHDGQIFPFNLMERGIYKYFYGLYRAGDFYVYVTSGAGAWGPPLRLFTRTELPLFVLRPAN